MNIIELQKKTKLQLKTVALIKALYEIGSSEESLSKGIKELFELNSNLEEDLKLLETLNYISIDRENNNIILRSKLNDLFIDKNDVIKVITYLNTKTGRKFSVNNTSTFRFISGRLNEGYTVDDLKGVVDIMVMKWGNDNKMRYYLRPETLFNSTKFQTYYNLYIEAKSKSDEGDWSIERT